MTANATTPGGGGALAKYNEAKRALAEAHRVDEVTRQHRRRWGCVMTRAAFHPNSLRLAKFMLQSRADSLLELLDEIGNAWPNLPFADFWGGYVLTDTLIHCPEQIKARAEGLPEVGSDPVKWLDKVIALASPADTWGRA